MAETAQENHRKKTVGRVRKFLNSPLGIALITGIFTFIGAVVTSNKISEKNVNNLKLDLQQHITNSQTQRQTLINNGEGSTLPAKDEKKLGDKSNNSFNSEDWIFIRDIILNKEGYYCPQSPNFPSWTIWTKNKHKADSEISITFSLLDKTKNNKDPTLYISYGDKTSDAPDTFYRFNIFDGDLNTLRLYNREGTGVLFERSKNSAPLDKFITFTISPVFLNKKSSRLTLNPVISYSLDDGQEHPFQPENKFEINLPLSSSENQGDGFQYGFGVSSGDCFKIISSNI